MGVVVGVVHSEVVPTDGDVAAAAVDAVKVEEWRG